MNIDEREVRLNDYLDGLLPPEKALAVEAELARDPEYRALEQSLRTVMAEAAAMPKAIVPERDLWAEIEVRLNAPVTGGGRMGASTRFRYALLAASFAAVFLAGIFFAQYQQERTPPDPIAQGVIGEAEPSELVLVEAEYSQARDLLQHALDESRDRLSAETLGVVDENLVIIGNAIAEIKTALEEDPGNQRLMRSLVAAYDQEVDLLQQATQLPAQL
jgi:anti-sigma-K factor RskA